MIYILLCILFSTSILTVFKIASLLHLNVFKIIIINYLIACALGLVLALPISNSLIEIKVVLPFAVSIGLFFIALFFLVAKTTMLSGMTVTSIASKMSVVIPALFSIILYKESIGIFKAFGMIMALLALFMAVYKKRSTGKPGVIWLLPLILFIGNGVLDSILKFTQEEKLHDFDIYLFNGMVFGTALIMGLAIWPFRKRQIEKPGNVVKKELLLGLLLGLVNFGSLFAMVNALNSNIDSSLVFLLNNTGVVSLATITGYWFFKEKLSFLNLLGILLALSSIILMSLHSHG